MKVDIKNFYIIGLVFSLSSCKMETTIQLNDRGEWYVIVYSKDIEKQKIYLADTNNVIILPCEYETAYLNFQFIDAQGKSVSSKSIRYFGFRNEYEYNYHTFYLATVKESELNKGDWVGTSLQDKTYNKQMWLIEDLQKKGYQSLLERCNPKSMPSLSSRRIK